MNKIATRDEMKEGLKLLKQDFYFAYGIAAPKRDVRDKCPRRACSGNLRKAKDHEIPAHLKDEWKYTVLRCDKCNTSMHLTPHHFVGATDVDA